MNWKEAIIETAIIFLSALILGVCAALAIFPIVLLWKFII